MLSLEPVATGNSSGPECGDVASAATGNGGNVTVATVALTPDSVSSSTDSAVVRSPSPPLPSNALAAATVESPVSPPSDDVPMEVDDHASLATPMEVDNHASLGDTPPAISSARKSIPPVNLDTLDLSKVPAWLQLPLKHLLKKFRGEVEDAVLSAFIALEMAWQPVREPFFIS